MPTLYVSNDRVVHHQQFTVVCCITQLCTIVRMGRAVTVGANRKTKTALHIRTIVELCNAVKCW